MFVAKKIPSELEVAEPHKLLIRCLVLTHCTAQNGLWEVKKWTDGRT